MIIGIGRLCHDTVPRWRMKSLICAVLSGTCNRIPPFLPANRNLLIISQIYGTVNELLGCNR
jgi:hypothetical protein